MVIRWHRIQAVMVRYMYDITQDWVRVLQLFYWPLLDVLIWGYVGVWVNQGAVSASVAQTMIIAVMLWNLVVRGSYEISVNFLEEIWSNNLINLFSSPLYLREWLIAAVLLSLGLAGVVSIFLTGVVHLIYGLNVLQYGAPMLAIASQLLFSGIWIGILSTSLVVVWGRRVDALVYMIGWVFLPFSCAYYTIDTLAPSIQYISCALPMTYAFSAMRAVVNTGALSQVDLMMAVLLNVIYAGAALGLFHILFKKSCARGLARLMN